MKHYKGLISLIAIQLIVVILNFILDWGIPGWMICLPQLILAFFFLVVGFIFWMHEIAEELLTLFRL